VILIDTHVFVWWVQGDPRLSDSQKSMLKEHEGSGIYVSIISFWEIAKLVEKKRLTLPLTLDKWFNIALSYPGIKLLDLDLDIILEIYNFRFEHKYPADQIIVATSISKKIPLFTFDNKLLGLRGIDIIKP
jgi:PIN domain nuclease of toxin-antitoxin system